MDLRRIQPKTAAERQRLHCITAWLFVHLQINIEEQVQSTKQQMKHSILFLEICVTYRNVQMMIAQW